VRVQGVRKTTVGSVQIRDANAFLFEIHDHAIDLVRLAFEFQIHESGILTDLGGTNVGDDPKIATDVVEERFFEHHRRKDAVDLSDSQNDSFGSRPVLVPETEAWGAVEA